MDDPMNAAQPSSPDANAMNTGMESPVPAEQQEKQIKRGEPEIPEARRRLVSEWTQKIKADKKHWENTFKQMRRDQDFAYGKQWSDDRWDDGRYIANVTLRHVQQRVAALYAKNPKVVAQRRQRLMSTVWDGTMGSVMTSMQQLAMAEQSGNPQAAQQPMMVMQDAQQTTQYKDQMDKFGKTLELLYDYNIDEQVHPFKIMMKLMVRRAVTTGVGYVKLGFQRVMDKRPEKDARIADISERLATLERMTADIADGVNTDEHSQERESLRLQMEAIQNDPEQVVREGIVFDYPDSLSIIPDRRVRQLREFLGADYVTQEYVLSPDEIKEIYAVDVGAGHRKYRPGTTEDPTVSPITGDYDPHTDSWSYEAEDPQKESHKQNVCLVWETYDRKTGLVYVTCDGYKDFLREPSVPDVWTERFYPWFPLVLNECDHPTRVYPPSDVYLIRDQQKEYNRLREAMREHRIANRPATVVAAGVLSESDTEKMVNRPSNALIELDGLQPGQSVDQLMQAFKGPGLDPNLYEVNPIFEDILRTVGVQEANLGSAGGATATETSIAESSRQSSLASNVDDLDDMLTQMARAAGQILLAEVNAETVKEVVGPGAMWPELTRDQLAKEIFLEIEAGSTGKPNQAQEVQNFERLAPILMQIPGVTPEMMAKEAIRRLDDRLELDDVYDQNMLSIQAMNQSAGQQPGNPPGEDPAAQGAEGANNAQQPSGPAGASGPGTNPQQVQ